jgi:hypothetical protein
MKVSPELMLWRNRPASTSSSRHPVEELEHLHRQDRAADRVEAEQQHRPFHGGDVARAAALMAPAELQHLARQRRVGGDEPDDVVGAGVVVGRQLEQTDRDRAQGGQRLELLDDQLDAPEAAGLGLVLAHTHGPDLAAEAAVKRPAARPCDR